ncbi:hypothetical protein FHS78_002790 [Parvibaculum indicum]|uniref:hypothetical protein n=1 Tax=Parvibaculum indicum TaxID=562969 RepID=UPI001420B551|nr:hypothetical protein [Parvibaculum indicum]NIJ42488.1 hypothetical protein [Parvibaculum indicum]
MRFTGRTTPTAMRAAGTIAAGVALAFLALPQARAANAVLESGTKTIASGERAVFAIEGAASVPTDLAAQCTIRDVTGRAAITFDAEGYVPLSEPAVGDRLSLMRGETKNYSLNGAIRPTDKGESYIAFSMIDQPASFCFPGMECGGKDEVANKATVACRNAGE